MRHQAVILAALGLALALPVSAAVSTAATAPVALTASVTAAAGILPTSSLSFIDKAFDWLSIAVAITPAAKADAALQVAQEDAAEAAVMSEAGNVALTTTSIANVETALNTAVVSALKITDPTAAAAVQQQVETSTLAAQETLKLGIAAAPTEIKPQIEALVAPTIEQLVAAPATVAAGAAPTAPVCDAKLFASCVQDNGCTLDTSQKCFLACPPKTVPCLNAAAGKTCSVPDTACVNDCLQKIAGCTETCLAQASCDKGEVSTSTLQIIQPEAIQKSFQIQTSVSK